LKLLIKKLLLFVLLFNVAALQASNISFSKITTIKKATQVEKNVFFNDGVLYLKGFEGPGKIEIYSIIGNKITETQTQGLSSCQFLYPLEQGNMYIIRVISQGEVNTFKVVAS
jgi:hypothetical protein